MKGVIFMISGKKKYSTELKLEIVKRYLHGKISLRSLAAKNTTSIPSSIGIFLPEVKLSVTAIVLRDTW